jgi:hypothetical protein
VRNGIQEKGEEKEEKKGEDKGRRRELEKINLNSKIYILMCINVFFFPLIFCFVED